MFIAGANTFQQTITNNKTNKYYTLQYDTNQPIKSHNKQQRSQSFTENYDFIFQFRYIGLHSAIKNRFMIIIIIQVSPMSSYYYSIDPGRVRWSATEAVVVVGDMMCVSCVLC